MYQCVQQSDEDNPVGHGSHLPYPEDALHTWANTGSSALNHRVDHEK